MTRMMLLEMKRRSIRLSTAPTEWSVLTVVLPGRVVPLEAERLDVAPGFVGERESIRGRMTGVIERERLGCGRIDAHRAFCRHIEQARGLHGPLDAIARKRYRRRFDAAERADQAR